MRLTILGSGTLLPDPLHQSPAHFLEFGDVRLLLDCSSGVLHGMARERLWWRGLSHLLVTHFHTDHVGDLAPILFALEHGVHPQREEPLVPCSAHAGSGSTWRRSAARTAATSPIRAFPSM